MIELHLLGRLLAAIHHSSHDHRHHTIHSRVRGVVGVLLMTRDVITIRQTVSSQPGDCQQDDAWSPLLPPLLQRSEIYVDKDTKRAETRKRENNYPVTSSASDTSH